MSFRLYPSNPVLQRLREAGNIKVHPEINIVPPSPAHKELHPVLSAYGELASWHSFATSESTPSSCNVRSKRRCSSAQFQSSVLDDKSSKLQVCEPKGSPLKTIAQPEALPVPIKVPKLTDDLPNQPILTGRPVFVREKSPDDMEHSRAVILQARREKLTHAIPRKIRLLPKVPFESGS